MQLADSSSLLVAWRVLSPDKTPRDVEREMIREFGETFGKPPFANDPHRLGW